EETCSELLTTLELLSKKTTGTLKHTLSLNELSPQVLPLTEKNPNCTFISDPKESYFIGADFMDSGKRICLWGSSRKLYRFPVDSTGSKLINNVASNVNKLGVISPDGNIVTWLHIESKNPSPNITFYYIKEKRGEADNDFARFVETHTFSQDSKSLFISFLPISYYAGEDIYGLMSKIDAYTPRKLIFWFSDPELNPIPTPKPRAHTTTVTSITCSPDDAFVVSTAENDPIVKVWNAQTGKLLKWRNLHTPALSAAISKDSALIAMGDEKGRIAIWDYKNDKLFGTLETNKPVCGLDWSPDGKILLVRTKETTNDISLWSVDKKVCLETLNYHFTETEHSVDIFSPKAIFSPDGNFILVGNAHEITLWPNPLRKTAVDWFKTSYKTFEPILNKKKITTEIRYKEKSEK
ncbi:MAG: WD40 repeat-containing protein, partial [candidate division TM6 bacterium GW2011_GWE2_42_60]